MLAALMSLTVSFLTLIAVFTQSAYSTSVSVVYTFPLGTWIENLAVRSNGLILGTKANVPEVWQVDPSTPNTADLVAVIPGHLALSGIVEVQSDVFYVGANNFTLEPPGVQVNASAVYCVDLGGYLAGEAVVPRLVVEFKVSGLLNGFTRLSDRYVLIADAGLGLVYRLDVETSEVLTVISDPLMAVTNPAKEPIGVNGVKVKDGYLYWSNTNQELLAKISVSPDGMPLGEAEVVAYYAAPDDFIVESEDSFLVAGNDELRKIEAGQVVTLSDDLLLKGSTAVQFGRGANGYGGKLFVSTNGGVEQYSKENVTVPGRIVQVELGWSGW